MEEETKSPKQEEERRSLTSWLQGDEGDIPQLLWLASGGSGQAGYSRTLCWEARNDKVL